MYWLDGSPRLPFISRCSYWLSRSRAKKFALAQDLIENQAQIVKSCVKMQNFDHWCIEASELVDLVWRDEKYLRRDGLSSHKESLHRISNLTSQYVKSVKFLTFELASSRLEPKRAILHPQPPPTKPEVPTSSLTPAANAVTASSCHSLLRSPTTTTTTQHSHDNRTGTSCPTPHAKAPDGKA